MIEEVLNKLVDLKLSNVFTSMPGKIVKYDASIQKAQVKPLTKIATPLFIDRRSEQFKELTPNSFEYEELDVIFSVPVFQYSGNNGKSFISLPIKKGDIGMLLFTTYPLEGYVDSDGSLYEAKFGNCHDLNNAYFLPGVLPFKAALKDVPEDDLFIKHENSTITLKSDEVEVKQGNTTITLDGGSAKIECGSASIELNSSGKIKLMGPGVELLDILVTLVNEGLILATVPTMLGPQSLTSVITPLPELLTKLNILKG